MTRARIVSLLAAVAALYSVSACHGGQRAGRIPGSYMPMVHERYPPTEPGRVLVLDGCPPNISLIGTIVIDNNSWNRARGMGHFLQKLRREAASVGGEGICGVHYDEKAYSEGAYVGTGPIDLGMRQSGDYIRSAVAKVFRWQRPQDGLYQAPQH